jgi:MFS family permease
MLLFAGPLAGRIGARIGFKWPLATGLAIVAVAAAGLCFFHTEPWHIWFSQGCSASASASRSPRWPR